MAKFLLTNRAASDLSDIADFTIQTFGIEQARFYRDGLNHCFEILAENPQLGRNATELAPNLKRFEYQSHVVFYVPKESHILMRAYFAPAHGFLAAFTGVFNKIIGFIGDLTDFRLLSYRLVTSSNFNRINWFENKSQKIVSVDGRYAQL